MAAVGGAYEACYNAVSSAGQAQATANIGAAVGYMNGTLASGKTASDAETDAGEAYVGSMAGSFAALVSSVASAATTFSQAASGEMVTYVAASASAVQSLVTTVADAARTRSDAAADAAKAASDSAVGAINAYVVGMLPASLTAYESIVDSVESWQGTGISTSIAALRAAVDATHTRDVAAANAALTAANAAAAADDVVAVKQAQRDKAAAILEAIQAKNELEAKDASEFAGMGPGGFFSTVTGYIGGMWDSTVEGIQEFAHWAWNDGLDMATDFTTGWADTLTGGAHARVRQFLGIDDYVNYDSYAYMGGQAVGTVHGFMLGGAAGATAHAGRAYTVARAFTTVETAWSMGEAGVNIYQGDAGLGDALAFAPAPVTSPGE